MRLLQKPGYVYFTSGRNKEYCQEVVDFIKTNYMLELRTVQSDIYRLSVR